MLTETVCKELTASIFERFSLKTENSKYITNSFKEAIAVEIVSQKTRTS